MPKFSRATLMLIRVLWLFFITIGYSAWFYVNYPPPKGGELLVFASSELLVHTAINCFTNRGSYLSGGVFHAPS